MNQTLEHFHTAESRAQASLDSAEARKRSDKIQQLRAAIEAVEGERMKSPRDFETLHQHIFEKIHQSISTSTLKRVWGYMSGYSSVRPHTLDLLARYIDYRDFEHFCEQQGGIPAVEPASSLSTRQSGLLSRLRSSILLHVGLGILLLLLIGGAIAVVFYHLGHRQQPSVATNDTAVYTIHQGQIFPHTDDYLRLFGITSAEHPWDVSLPHHQGIIIWGPEYQHPQWHNEGDRDLMMSSITEYWEPAENERDQVTAHEVAARNESLYFTVARTNELRITFMKNLTDTGYVFLGIYRMNMAESDSTHVVWERVADSLNLLHLDYLEQLRR